MKDGGRGRARSMTNNKMTMKRKMTIGPTTR
jgi:hypothetical protein